MRQDGYVEVDGLNLHYLDWGDSNAPVIVLLHGLEDCASSWDFFSSNMSRDFRVIALDSRGHGDSDWSPEGDYRFESYLADLESLVDQLQLDQVILVGHGAGGASAFSYAAAHPDRVRFLAVVDADPDAVDADAGGKSGTDSMIHNRMDSLEAVIKRLRTRRPQSSDEMLEHQALSLTSDAVDGERVWKADRRLMSAYRRPDLWQEWAMLRCPTLILIGRQSAFLRHEVAVKMSEAIPRARLAELEGGGHWFYQEFPGAFETTIRWFLENPPG